MFGSSITKIDHSFRFNLHGNDTTYVQWKMLPNALFHLITYMMFIYKISALKLYEVYNDFSFLDIEKWSNQCFRYHKMSLFYPPIYHLDVLDDYQEHTWQILGHQWRRKALSELLSNLHLCFRSLQSETIEMCTKCIKYYGTFRFL